jgi:hypothetical protein
MKYSKHRRVRRHSNLLLIPDLRAFVQCTAVNVRFLFTSWNGFLRPAGTRHTWQARYSRQVYALMMKLKTLYSERFLLECVQCESAINPLTKELNPSAQRCLTRFIFTGILLLEPYISLIYAWKTNKYTNYSFSLLIMYGSSYMFQHYFAIYRERS